MNLNENYNSQQIIGYCKFACAASESAHACNSYTTSNLLCHPEIEPSLRLQLEASEICSPIDKREIVLGLNKWTFSTIHTPCTFGMVICVSERDCASVLHLSTGTRIRGHEAEHPIPNPRCQKRCSTLFFRTSRPVTVSIMNLPAGTLSDILWTSHRPIEYTAPRASLAEQAHRSRRI